MTNHAPAAENRMEDKIFVKIEMISSSLSILREKCIVCRYKFCIQFRETAYEAASCVTWSAGLSTLRRLVIQNLWVRREQSAARIAFSNTSLTPKNVRTLVSKYDMPISFATARPEH